MVPPHFAALAGGLRARSRGQAVGALGRAAVLPRTPECLHRGPEAAIAAAAYGLLYASFGLGAVIGALSIGTVFAKTSKPRLTRLGLLAAVAGSLTLAGWSVRWERREGRHPACDRTYPSYVLSRYSGTPGRRVAL